MSYSHLESSRHNAYREITVSFHIASLILIHDKITDRIEKVYALILLTNCRGMKLQFRFTPNKKNIRGSFTSNQYFAHSQEEKNPFSWLQIITKFYPLMTQANDGK